jgi:tetratricopeptide (TPR) repeat protein
MRKQRSSAVCLAALLATLCAVMALPAQNPPEKTLAEEAVAFYQAQEWEKAAAAYQTLVERERTNALAWFHLGTSQHHLKHYEQAVAAFEQAEKNGFFPQFVAYSLAASYARMNEKEKAFEWLEKAVAAGYGNPEDLEGDEDLAGLRDDPRFGKIVQGTKVNARPCEYLEVYRQFDFWVGDWDVFSPNGRKQGSNSIQKVAGGCVLLENWTSASGPYTGKSINYYDPLKKKWVQRWADSSGAIIPTEGEFEDGAMRLSGQLIDRQGGAVLFRGTWTPLPDGRVRQLLEQSKDDGKTWTVWFDGYYTRKKTVASE